MTWKSYGKDKMQILFFLLLYKLENIVPLYYNMYLFLNLFLSILKHFLYFANVQAILNALL